ncbi:hypothetical protein NHX12_025236, partial [Muraenolepis orangiensis]
MSEGDVPLGFNRMNRLRQSLPLARSSSQAKLRAPGVLFLQLGEETRRVHLTHELTSLDTLRALIVHMCPSTALLIKDETRNVFYELEDPRDVQDRCVIKIYCKEPIYGSYQSGPHISNGDIRCSPEAAFSIHQEVDQEVDQEVNREVDQEVDREVNREVDQEVDREVKQHPDLCVCFTSPSHHQREMVYAPQDSPPGRRSGGGGGGVGGMNRPSSYAGPAHHHHHHTHSLPHPHPHPHHSSPLHPQPAFCPSPSAILERRDVKPDEEPPGPHGKPPPAASRGAGRPKMTDLREPYGATLPGRGSPGQRQGLRRGDSSSLGPGGVFGDQGPKARGPGLSLGPEQLCLMGGPGGGDGGGGPGAFSSPLLRTETETRERMEVMEKQIASLTGLLKSVLSRGPAQTPSAPLALMPPPPSGANQPIPVSRLQMQLHLQGLQQNTNSLRSQLSQLRHIQLENQDEVLSLLRQTESELSVMMLEAMRTQEDPLQRQRLLVEEERLKYLNQQELVIQQLHDLEHSVEGLQKNLTVNQGLVTEQEVEQKSKELRRLGETLTELKNQFPSLQSKMRVVLRVEVEAVKFLKEEPHRLDALLRRCNSMTETLSSLRRQVSEAVWKSPDDPLTSKRSEVTCRGPDPELLNSPPLSLSDLSDLSGVVGGLANWRPGLVCEADGSGPDQDPLLSFRTRGALDELPSRRPADKGLSAEVRLAAERDWEEKRATLTQFSAQDINRLLEETQAELLKALPDLDLAARHASKPAVPPNGGGDSHPGKVQMAAQKLNNMEGGGSRRGSTELSVGRYRTEKPSKSPPPPPPRRSFPTAHGLTTNRSGELILTPKTAKEEEEPVKAVVKLRRAPSEGPRPASTPPVISASAVRDQDEEEKIIAELEGPTKALLTPGQ